LPEKRRGKHVISYLYVYLGNEVYYLFDQRRRDLERGSKSDRNNVGRVAHILEFSVEGRV
jgi:hypothetical protein